MSEDSTPTGENAPSDGSGRRGMDRLANEEPIPSMLYLETARAGGETVALRARFSELREKVLEAGNDINVLDVEELCLYQVLNEIFSRGFVNTSSHISVPARFLPRRGRGETKEAFLEREAATHQRVRGAFESAFRFIMRPGITEEGAAAMQADVENRRQVFDRELGETDGQPEPTDKTHGPAGDQE